MPARPRKTLGYRTPADRLAETVCIDRLNRRGRYRLDQNSVPNEIIPYLEMCRREGVSLQRGMNFSLGGNH